MNQCIAAATREDCLAVPGQSIQEGKVCGLGNTCDNPPGNAKAITWWEHCPTNEPCPGPTLGDIDGVIGCVDDAADALVDGLLCLQFPNGVACPTPAVPTPTPTQTPPLLCGDSSAPECNGACPTDAGNCQIVGGACACVGGLPTPSATPTP